MSKNLSLEGFDDGLGPMRWYVVCSEPGRERQAFASLRGQGFRPYLPMRAIHRKTAIHAAPLFPRYLFVQLNLEEATWWKVFTSQGVSAIVTRTNSDGRPLPVPMPRRGVMAIRKNEVDGIIVLTTNAPAKPPRSPAPFQSGDRVRINGGAFVGFEAIFQHGDSNRVAVLLSILGAENRVEISTAQVCKVAGA